MFCSKYLPMCIYITMKKKVFCNLACNSIFELQWPFATLCFYTHECYRTSCMSCKRCNSPYISHSSATHYNSIATTTPFQLLCTSPMTKTIMSCWCYFSSIHQNLTGDILKIFGWCFLKYWYSSSIMIIHFKWFLIMTCGTIKSYHMAY